MPKRRTSERPWERKGFVFDEKWLYTKGKKPVKMNLKHGKMPGRRIGKTPWSPGLQTMITPRVIKYSKQFKGRNIKTVKAIVEDIAGFEFVKVNPEYAKWLYAKRTAEDILHSKKIPYLEAKDKADRIAGISFIGCVDMCIGLLGVLREKGIPAKLIRFKVSPRVQDIGGRYHSVVWFQLHGKEYVADPFARIKERRLLQVDKIIPGEKHSWREKRKALIDLGRWSEGSDMWDLGITGFDKYNYLKPMKEWGKKKK